MDEKSTARTRALAASGIGAAAAQHYEVHHLVECGRVLAEPSRQNLMAVGVGLHSLPNLLPLPKPHQSIHTRRYTAAVVAATTIARPSGYATMIATLERIKLALKANGRFP
jgi:hypothetical protein